MDTKASKLRLPADSYQRRGASGRFFALVFAISWTASLIVMAPSLFRGQALSQFEGLMVFPAMLLGPLLSGLLMTRFERGKAGLRDLFSRLRLVHFRKSWYAALLVPPLLVYGVLRLLSYEVTPSFAPNWFPVGISFGFVAGLAEEVGWMGYAFPTMIKTRRALPAALSLGVLWALWHIPAIDHLGTAVPHRSSWFPFFLAFAAAMVAMRVIICWVYVNTGSVLMSQLLHASSTGALVVFSPTMVTGRQEAFWYGVYALVLWIVVAVVITTTGLDLKRARPA